MTRTKDPADRFWPKVDMSGGPDACWPWMAARHRFGYGRFRVGGAASKMANAHRVAWALVNGPVGEGLVIRHFVCDNPPCCNPAHLRAGTTADNMADMDRRGRRRTVALRGDQHWLRTHPESRAWGERNGSHTHPECIPRGLRTGAHTHPEKRPRGETNGRAKLSVEQIRTMRELNAQGVDCATLARTFGVSRGNAWRICRGVSWTHL